MRVMPTAEKCKPYVSHKLVCLVLPPISRDRETDLFIGHDWSLVLSY